MVCVWALGLLSACSSFEGKIIKEAEFNRNIGAPVYDASAAFVINSALKNLKISINKSIYPVYPEVLDVMAAHLRGVFTKVDLVDEYALDRSRYDLLLVPEFHTSIDYDTINVESRWKVMESQTNRQVALIVVSEYSEQEKSFMDGISKHSIDLSVSYTNDRNFSKMLYQSAIATINRFKDDQQLRQYVARLARGTDAPQPLPLAPAAAAIKDTTPPTIVVISPKVQRGLSVSMKKGRVTVIGTASDESGVAEVLVNGRTATLDERGGFSAEALLKVGENQIVITATDVRGNSATDRFTLVREGDVAAKVEPAPVTAPPLAKGKNYALVVGINAYRYLDRLKTATNDATEVSRILREQYGYEIKLLLDGAASHDGIMKELNTLRSRLTANDRLLIYYAGHGILEKTTDASYWLPVDAENNDDTKWIDSKRISDQLKRITARQVLVIADSCYSGTLTRQASVELSGNDTRESYLRKLQERPSRVLIASGGNEPVSDAGGSGHSLFAETFMAALAAPPTPVFTASELLITKIKEAVAGRAEQTPEYKIIRNSGHEGGDFIFEKLQ